MKSLRIAGDTLDGIVASLGKMRGCRPYHFSGRWYVTRVKDGFCNYRTIAAAKNNSVDGTIWEVKV